MNDNEAARLLDVLDHLTIWFPGFAEKLLAAGVERDLATEVWIVGSWALRHRLEIAPKPALTGFPSLPPLPDSPSGKADAQPTPQETQCEQRNGQSTTIRASSGSCA
jgi:hypothetical protein